MVGVESDWLALASLAGAIDSQMLSGVTLITVESANSELLRTLSSADFC